jgi:hypothetical protein
MQGIYFFTFISLYFGKILSLDLRKILENSNISETTTIISILGKDKRRTNLACNDFPELHKQVKNPTIYEILPHSCFRHHPTPLTYLSTQEKILMAQEPSKECPSLLYQQLVREVMALSSLYKGRKPLKGRRLLRKTQRYRKTPYESLL